MGAGIRLACPVRSHHSSEGRVEMNLCFVFAWLLVAAVLCFTGKHIGNNIVMTIGAVMLMLLVTLNGVS